MNNRHLLVFVLVLLMWGPARAQEATAPALPEVPYFSAQNTSARFNVPVPAGWADQSTANRAYFVNGDLNAEIVALALQDVPEAREDTPVSREIAIRTALAQVLPAAPSPDLVARHSADISLSNGRWTFALYTLPDDTDVTGFAQTRPNATYILLYINRAPGDFFMLAVQPERTDAGYDVQTGIALALGALYPTAGEIQATDTVELSNGTWTRDTYAPFNDQPLVAIGQARGDAVYVVVENGAENLLQNANKIFFTTFFGWFVTPFNDSYLLLGLGAVAVLMIGLVASFGLRYLNLRRDLSLVRTLHESG